MKISRIFNNNSVGAVLPDGREAVLVGPGLGWNKHRGDTVDDSQVEKRYSRAAPNRRVCVQSSLLYRGRSSN